ncbi:phosphatidate phosphatase App1 family protein [Formosa sp. 4Alg 33]|uniref:phosphatidate phosphatase App1 family protein n=1 Tax=Formosa sp. 4Alg 33 TaxID=3382189 RepID=UPI003D9C403D
MVYSKKASVWELSVLQLATDKVWYKGVVLKGNRDIQNKKGKAFQNAIRVICSYFTPVLSNQEICIHTKAGLIFTKTDTFGRFQAVSDKAYCEDLKITLSGSDEVLKLIQNYPVFFQEEQRTLDIISDIDDTILVSNTANIFQRIKTLLFLVPERRTVIEFTKNIFQAWEDVNPRLFYVSKSESNLFGLLTTFIKHNELPLGVLTLTPYLSFFQLIKGQKPIDFKLNAIRFLITQSRSKHYILVGDDTQKDMAIYTTLAKAYPELILKIYIRRTGKDISETQQKMWEELLATGTSASYFLPEHADSILKEIQTLKEELI